MTYFTQLTLESDNGSPPGAFDVETAYLLWNDIVGPRHALNLWVGRLFAPQLTSFGLHSSYLADTVMPATSVGLLYNPSASFMLGLGHTDGAELNGILAHRFNYALGWVASSLGSGLLTPNSEDVYAHIGVKSGGVALDGEGKYGPNVPDPRKPWAEKSITLDAFAYHGLARLDNGTGTIAGGPAAVVQQDDKFFAAGGVIHAQWESLIAMAGAQFEYHDQPYQGSAAMMGAGGMLTNGTPVTTHATAFLQYDELNYVVWPWFVPGVRTEFTHVPVEPSPGAPQADSNLLRIIPGIAMLVRPNIRVILRGELEWAHNLPAVANTATPPPQPWSAANGSIVPVPGAGGKFEAESINASLAYAF
jgi:hypothetical protein